MKRSGVFLTTQFAYRKGLGTSDTLLCVSHTLQSGQEARIVQYCSAVWCSAADTHLKLLDRAVSGARFLTGGVFECDIGHRRSVAVLCLLYKIR